MALASEGRLEGDGSKRLAVLIDADNAQAAIMDALFAEIARYGTATARRIYGDFTSTNLQQWKKLLLSHSILAQQQYAYTSGKNSTDSALIIDAMDLMYTRRFDGFCLVSSDSDFTRLAQRLREEGLTVYGFGEKKTPEPFVKACDKFIYTEVLRAPVTPPSRVAATSPTSSSTAAPKPKATGRAAAASPPSSPAAGASPSPPPKKGTTNAAPTAPGEPFDLILQAIDESDDESGWAHLGAVGNYLTKVRPDFDARLYGHTKLSQLLRSQPTLFELEERAIDGSTAKRVFVRPARR